MRRAIFERLARGPLPVVELARRLPISRPAVSQHLKVLKAARLVADHAEGTRRVYRIDPHGLASVREYFDRFWTDALDAFKRVVEESQMLSAHDDQRKQPKERKEKKK